MGYLRLESWKLIQYLKTGQMPLKIMNFDVNSKKKNCSRDLGVILWGLTPETKV